MELRFQYWLSTGLAGILLTLVIANVWLYMDNQERQQVFTTRQALIMQVQQVDLPLYRDLAQVLADFAKKGDKQIELLLAGEKITLTPTTSSQQPPGQTATPTPSEPGNRDSTRPGRPKGRP